ncbi:MAG: hypothetical protein U0271_41820 [Polyangiaceae bacterium]
MSSRASFGCLTSAIGGLAMLVATLGGCGNCPYPQFATPVKAEVVKADSPETTVVVRWPAAKKDPIPDSYYGMMRLRTSDLDPVVKSAESTAPRELTIHLTGLDAYLAKSHELTMRFDMPDTRLAVSCSHPGQPDSYSVGLTLRFAEDGHLASAEFDEVALHAGAL